MQPYASPGATYSPSPRDGSPMLPEAVPLSPNPAPIYYDDHTVVAAGSGVRTPPRGKPPSSPGSDVSQHRQHPGQQPFPGKSGGGGRDGARALVMCCFCVSLVAFTLVIMSLLHMIGSPVQFDCQDGRVEGWSAMKQEYCCEDEGIGCATAGGGGFQRPGERPPAWLGFWRWDLSLGIKFAITATLFLSIGVFCGAFCYLRYLRKQVEACRSQTEHELKHELKKALQRAGAKTGEISVTLMWDTKDDLDLHLKLPPPYGEISPENPRCAGGIMDIDANRSPKTATGKAVENIYFPAYDSSSNHHPPTGKFEVTVKAYERHATLCVAVNITVVVAMQDEETIYHLRMLPGCTQLRICSFTYSGPRPAGGAQQPQDAGMKTPSRSRRE